MKATDLIAWVGMLCFFLKIVIGQTIVNAVVQEGHNPYFRSGTFGLSMSVYVPTKNQSRTIVPYSTPLMTSNYQIMTSITSIDIGVDPINPTVSYNVSLPTKTINQFQVRFYSVVLSKITYAKLTYLCIDNAIRNLQFYLLQNYFGDGVPGLLAAQSTYSDFIFNFTSKISRHLIAGNNTYVVEPYLKGFKSINWNAQAYSVELIGSVVNNTFYRIEVKSSIVTDQEVTQLYATVLVYNSTLIQYYTTMFNSYTVNFTSSAQIFNSFGLNKINQSNFFVGVRGFRFSYPTYSFYFDFLFDFPSNQIQLNGFYPPILFMIANIISVEYWQCPDPLHPYFMNWTHKCYSSCPTVRYYKDPFRDQCNVCMYDCYTCETGNNCTSCNSSNYFREQDLKADGTLRCKALSGYYSTRFNDIGAKKCDVGCVECFLEATNCTKCKQGQYLNLVNFAGSCNNCPLNCLECTDGQTCNLCANLYTLDSSSLCTPICSTHCSTCHILTTPVQTSICDTCKLGYYIDSQNSSQCVSRCGDGILAEGYEQCDDNNTSLFDGCNAECKLQPGYQCYFLDNDTAQPQICFYEKEIKFWLKGGFHKIYRKNTFQFQLAVQTVNSFIFRELNWTNIILIDAEYFSLSHTVVTDVLQPQNKIVLINFTVDYKPTIKSSIEIQIDPKRNNQPLSVSQSASSGESSQQYKTVSSLVVTSSKFDTTPATKETFSLKSENNIAIIYESDTFIAMAEILQYFCHAIAGITLLLVAFSFTIYGGKIVALEYMFVVSCAYFSLIGFENIQFFSIFEALNGLKVVSFNFNPIKQVQSTSLWWAGFTNSFTNNCLGLLIFMSLPISYLITFAIMSKVAKNSQTLKKLESIKKYYGYEETSIAFYMIGAYGFTTNFFLSLYQTIKGIYSDISGIGIGFVFFVSGIILFILAIKRKNCLWQFKDNFYQNSIRQHYINFSILTIWFNCISITVLKDLLFGNVIPIILSFVSIGCLIKFIPFKKDVERRRPIIVQVFNILVQGTFLTLKIMLSNNNQLAQTSQILLYLPFLVAFFLALGLTHTIYCFFIKIKNAIIDRKQFLENQKLYSKGQIKQTLASQNQEKQGKSIQTMIQPIDKDIMQSFRKQKGFNFISNALDFSNDELQRHWNNFEKVQSKNAQINIDKAKQLRKTIKKSLFLTNKHIEPYFKFNFDSQKHGTPEVPSKKPENDQKIKEHLGQCQNCGQKIDSNFNDTSNYIIYKHEQEKYNEEWKQLFKPKELTEEQKKHSLAIYDMI